MLVHLRLLDNTCNLTQNCDSGHRTRKAVSLIIPLQLGPRCVAQECRKSVIDSARALAILPLSNEESRTQSRTCSESYDNRLIYTRAVSSNIVLSNMSSQLTCGNQLG
jgi:hypothetical protein